MQFNAEIIASFLEGEIEGNSEAAVSTVAKIEEGHPGAISFLANPKYEHFIYTTQSSIVIVNKDFVPSEPVGATLIKVDDAYSAFASLLDLYNASKPQKEGVSSLAAVGKDCTLPQDLYLGEFAVLGDRVKIGENVKIYPQAYIGDGVVLGNNVTIYSGAKIYDSVVIGNDVIIHSGAVIGADGFGFAPTETGFTKIAQIGNVVLEDGVEIGANTCVDRATMGSTFIKKGVKLDNLIQIGHNVVVGENTVFAAQVGVAGSTKIGKNSMFGGQVGVAGHLEIADGVKVSSQSGIAGNVKTPNVTLMGTPTMNAGDFKRVYITSKGLPDLVKKVKSLEGELAEIKALLASK